MAKSDAFNVGDLVRITGTWSDTAGTTVDPTTVTVYYKDPSSNITELVYGVDTDVVKSDTGIYYVDIDIDEPGNWYYRWKGVGVAQAADSDWFYINPVTIST
jgi:hypothetical protein